MTSANSCPSSRTAPGGRPLAPRAGADDREGHGRSATRRALGAAATLAASVGIIPAAVGDVPEVPAARSNAFRVEVEGSYSPGDYGTGVETDFFGITPEFEWLRPRSAYGIAIPFVHLRASADVVLIGGRPVPTPLALRLGPLVPSSAVDAERSFTGIGDTLLWGDATFLTGTATRPWVTGRLEVKVPTADEEKHLGTGEADLDAGVDVAQPVGRHYLLGSGGFTKVGDPPDFDLDDIVRIGVGFSWSLSERASILAFIENSSNPVPGLEERRVAQVGGEIAFGREQRGWLSGSLSFGLTDTSEEVSLALSLGGEF